MMLNYIKCYLDMSYEQKYDENNMWEGNIFIQENGFFEGIISNKESGNETLIFGIYYPDKFIRMYKVNSVFTEKPFRLDAKAEDESYEGNFYQIDLFGETMCGNCKIGITDRPLEEQNNVEIVFFQKKLDYFKNKKLDALAKDFYLRQKREICLLNKKELKEIISKCSPVNKNLMDEKTYYKLTRKIINIFQSDEFN